MEYIGNIYLRFASNSEANASELLANLEEKFHHYDSRVQIINE